ncbi:tetratricopeptide repeat protein [Winogradskyella litorisediminis]|uniref:Tetratricopeptide repeat protein n=1 Tax=Winogradskyella litorisediminis TaxID=1156618 RepID=A0ABW3N9G7_9FLAO
MTTSFFSRFLAILIVFNFFSCDSEKVSNKKDYQAFLVEVEDDKNLKSEFDFWNSKINNTPNQYPYYLQRAGVYTRMFDNTANIKYLKLAEQDLKIANEKTVYNNAGYLRALAHNYISQHKFKEALELLKKAETNGEKLKSTQKMLFDAHLELGNNQEAEKYLNKIKDFSDFDYLIRLSKWSDHNGDLDSAIKYMERASSIAESGNTNGLKQWSYTNLADFYGHAGKIKMSYEHFLKALELNPNDAYAKKGLAWIIYSYEKNPDEALNILNHVDTYYTAPDYKLLKAEIAEFKNDKVLQENALNAYKSQVENALYGDMYNQYNIELYSEEISMTEKAIEIAKIEVKNRPTAQTYDFLAWSYFKNGQIDKAYEITEKFVADRTSEPKVLYHMAEIYKAKGMEVKVIPLKEELETAIYELGPTLKTKIQSL